MVTTPKLPPTSMMLIQGSVPLTFPVSSSAFGCASCSVPRPYASLLDSAGSLCLALSATSMRSVMATDPKPTFTKTDRSTTACSAASDPNNF